MEILTGGRSIAKQKFFELEQKNIELQQEKQQLISFLEDKIKEYQKQLDFVCYEEEQYNLMIELQIKLEIYQEVIDFVNKGGKE